MRALDDDLADGFFAGLVRRPVALLVLLATLIVMGLLAYARIPLAMMPEGIQPQSLRIFALHPGSSPAENESQVARPLEEQLRTISGISDIESNSFEDYVSIHVRFGSDQDADVMKAEVRDRIERTQASLPATVERVQLYSWSQSDMPLMWFAVLAKVDSERTDYLMDSVVQRRLAAVDGVGQAEIFGMLDDSVRVLLDEDRVSAANLDIGELIRRLSSDNFALPMGEVEDGGRRILLRSDMRFRSPEEIAAFPIGAGLVLGDVARVVRAKNVRDQLSRINGSYAYWGFIRRSGQANVVATCERLEQAFDELRADARLSGDFDFLVVFDQGKFIGSSLDTLLGSALWGGGLAVAVLFVFLRRVRLTLCVALSIPISALLAVAWSYFSGGSLNVLTMTGITLALGMLVDNSIVVVENISRLVGTGLSRRAATVQGTREVGLAVALATLTTVVVFLPMIFMTSHPDMRVIFGELGLPLCLSLLFSLVVALVFLPVVAERVVGPRPAPAERCARACAAFAAMPARAVSALIGALRWLAHLGLRGLYHVERALLAALAPLRVPLALALAGLAAWRLASLPGSSAALAALERAGAAPPGAWRAEGRGLVAGALLPALGAILLVLWSARWRRGLARPPVRPARLRPRGNSLIDLAVGANRALVEWSLAHRAAASCVALACVLSVRVPLANMTIAPFGQDEEPTSIGIQIELESNFTLEEASHEFARYEEWLAPRKAAWGFENLATVFDISGGEVTLWWDMAQDPIELERLRRELRAELPRFAGHAVSIGRDEDPDGRLRSMLVFRLNGPDPDELERLGREAQTLLEGVPGIASVKSPLEEAPEQVRLVLDAETAHELGVSASVALENVAWALRGFALPRFHEPGREIPLILEYDEEQVAGLDTLRDLQIWTGTGVVPLTSVAQLEFARGSRAISRRNGKTAFTLIAQVDDPTQQQSLSEAGHAALAAMTLPRGYAWGEEDLVGRRQELEMGELRRALALSVVLVFLLMGILFESFLLPFSVLTTVPFAFVGGVWTLYLTGTTMDSVGWIGVIILVGVVVNNGIVLIDRIHRLRSELPRAAAVVEGSATRVRPILMTALTTVFGLLPMALSQPSGQGLDYRALATCVAGGLAVSTLFTLWVVPLAYTLLDDFATALAARGRWALRPLDPKAARALAARLRRAAR